MLADSVEASSRTLADPTATRLKSHIQKIIKGILDEGQLEEADITFRDLHLLAEAFQKVLTGIFHHRIAYPEAKKDGIKDVFPADMPGHPLARTPVPPVVPGEKIPASEKPADAGKQPETIPACDAVPSGDASFAAGAHADAVPASDAKDHPSDHPFCGPVQTCRLIQEAQEADTGPDTDLSGLMTEVAEDKQKAPQGGLDIEIGDEKVAQDSLSFAPGQPAARAPEKKKGLLGRLWRK